MNKDTQIYFADLESTGLLHQLVKQGSKARLHNFCAMNSESEKMFLFNPNSHEGKGKLTRFLDREIILVMHNGICYDKNALSHFGFDVSKVHFVDTLGLSWYLDLNRPKHGLEGYGEEAGVPKPEIKDWESLTQEDYDHRVQEDVKIQAYTYKKLKGMFEELYGKMSDYEFCTHKVVKYINFKMKQLEEQQNTRIKIDVPKAEKLVEDLTKELEDKLKQLTSAMPKVPVIAKHTMPKKPFKKDGSLSATGEKWKALTEQAGVDFEYKGTIETVKSYKEPNPQSSQQIKDWLSSYGWQPSTFKYVREDDGSDRKIPQIYIQGSGGQICESIEDLARKIPEVQHLTGVGVLKHRIGVVKGFLDSLVDGESVEAGASGFTNTLRLKHRKPFVNLPSNRVAHGSDVRGCIIAREGKILCGSDLSSLENNIKFNLQLPFDREGVESQLADDYDPHLEIAQEGGLVKDYEVAFFKIADKGFPVEKYPYSNELADLLMLPESEKKRELKRVGEIRSKGKSCNYACQYGAGAATVARTAEVPLSMGKQLVEAYKKVNWSIDVIAESHEIKQTSFGRFQKNKFNGMWYHLKYDKDKFSTGTQGSASYIFDLWIANIFHLRDTYDKYREVKDGIRLTAQAHDEIILEISVTYEHIVEELLTESLDRVNKTLKVEIPFSADVQFGQNYAQIH